MVQNVAPVPPRAIWFDSKTEVLSLRAGAILIACNALSALQISESWNAVPTAWKTFYPLEKDEGLVMVDQCERDPYFCRTYLGMIDCLLMDLFC